MAKKRRAAKEPSDASPTKTTHGTSQPKKAGKKVVEKNAVTEDEVSATSQDNPSLPNVRKANNSDVEDNIQVAQAGSADNGQLVTSSDGNAAGADLVPSSTTEGAVPRKRAASGKKKAASCPLPTSFETAAERDKLLWRMKEEGNSWKDIGDAIKDLTGVEPAYSTLPNRYKRLKAIFARSEDEDVNHFP